MKVGLLCPFNSVSIKLDREVYSSISNGRFVLYVIPEESHGGSYSWVISIFVSDRNIFAIQIATLLINICLFLCERSVNGLLINLLIVVQA